MSEPSDKPDSSRFVMSADEVKVALTRPKKPLKRRPKNQSKGGDTRNDSGWRPVNAD